ncbi:hypothetical protein BB561_006455 [Smittium simulii]|uniref:PX domain-containing protein n=1 Tax=Smittium simulii TaxID=133385 RepID=A0A2T9Y464_9FUNG|nr:hypothetical protein BB561_006503 [Smittium simulii]PVU87107.1 hypothetical protein BB561_006455 [Smittium simulii]
MFGSNFNDIIDPFAEEANAWGDSKPLSPANLSHSIPKSSSEFSPSEDHIQQLSPAHNQLNSSYSYSDSQQTDSFNAENVQSSTLLHQSVLTHTEESPIFDQQISISKDLKEKATISSQEPNAELSEDTKNQPKDSSPILLLSNSESPAARRPILFQKNKNKTRVLLSNKSQSASNHFVDPLSESQIINSPKDKAVSLGLNHQGTQDTALNNQSAFSASPSANSKKIYRVKGSNEISTTATINSIQFNPFANQDFVSLNESQQDLNITFQQNDDDILDDSDYKSDNEQDETYFSSTTKVSVSEPIKVTDSLSSHTVYKVSTQSSSSLFKASQFSVRRRYRDFEWLYQQLFYENPGIIIPPIPEKQSFGRFEQYFIENRQTGLQVHLDRVLAHPILCKNTSLILFLESEDFSTESKLLSDKRQDLTNTGSSFADLFGSNKYLIKNDPFTEKFKELELIESHLKALMKSLEQTNKQHEDLSLAHVELGEAFLELSKAENEFSSGNHLADLSRILLEMGRLQKKIEHLQGNIATKTKESLINTTEEYIRTVNSSRNTFMARIRAYNKYKNYESELEKLKKSLNQYNSRILKYKSNNGQSSASAQAASEKLNNLKLGIQRSETTVDNHLKIFESISLQLSDELERFDWLRVQSFQRSVESYLVSMIEIQDEIVGLWDGFSLLFESAV